MEDLSLEKTFTSHPKQCNRNMRKLRAERSPIFTLSRKIQKHSSKPKFSIISNRNYFQAATSVIKILFLNIFKGSKAADCKARIILPFTMSTRNTSG